MTINMNLLDKYKVPSSVRKTIHELFDGYNKKSNTCTIPKDYDTSISLISFINHSDQPNCKYNINGHTINTLRDINEGEEVTVDYLQCQNQDKFCPRHHRKRFQC